MAKQSFFINPLTARRRKLVAFGFRSNPRRRKKRKNPPTGVHFPAHDETLFRVGKTGRWGRKKRKGARKGVTPPHLKKFLFKKRRKSPAHKGGSVMARRKKSHRRAARSHRRKHRKNPFQVALGANPRRRRSSRRHARNPHRRARRHSFMRNPLSLSKLGLPPFKEMAWLTVGALAARVGVPRVIAALPILNKNGYTRALSRVGITAAASLVAQKVLKGNAKTFIYGVVANQLPEAVNDVASEMGFHLGLEDGENNLSLYTNSMPAGLPIHSDGGMGVYTGVAGVDEYEVPLG